MAVTVYSSTDASAPVLTGAVGSFIALLDACLVNGYGDKGAAGWSKDFSDTNLATYRPAFGSGCSLGVDDTNTLNVRVRGFEVATAAGVDPAFGTGLFPTEALLSGGGYIFKGADTTTANAWVFIVSDTSFYFFPNPSGASVRPFYFFGDCITNAGWEGASTPPAALVVSTVASDSTDDTCACVVSFGGTNAGHYLPRSYTEIGGCVPFGKTITGTRSNVIGGAGVNFPSPQEGALLVDRIGIGEANGVIRGRFPGLWHPLHNKPLADGDTFNGMSGRELIVKNIGSSSQVFVETSDTWIS